jgi:uncharacterized membrane protein YfcA
MSVILFFLGFVLLYRIIYKTNSTSNLIATNNPKFLTVLGFSSGFIDATGGGGWGMVVTPTMLLMTATEPRKVIGTVCATEFCIALAASLGFIININEINLDLSIIGGLAIGGIVAAPIASKFVSKMRPKHLGIIVSIAIITLNVLQIIGA